MVNVNITFYASDRSVKLDETIAMQKRPLITKGLLRHKKRGSYNFPPLPLLRDGLIISSFPR